MQLGSFCSPLVACRIVLRRSSHGPVTIPECELDSEAFVACYTPDRSSTTSPVMPFTKSPFSKSAVLRTRKHPPPSADRIDIGAARSSNMAIPSHQVIRGSTVSATQTLPPSSASSFSQHVTEETASHQHRATFVPATPPFDHEIAHPPLASLSIRQFPFSTARETSSSGFRTGLVHSIPSSHQ